MSLLGYENFLGEDEFSVDFIEEGKTLMKRGEVILSQYHFVVLMLIVERRMRERNISRGVQRNWVSFICTA